MVDISANSTACHPRATCHIAGCCHLRIQCHDPDPTCHITGCSHLANSTRSSQDRVSLCRVSLTTWLIHCHDPRATCHIAGCCHLAKSMSWWFYIRGCKNSIRHIESRFSPYFIFFVFLMQFGLWRAAAFVSSTIHLLVVAVDNQKLEDRVLWKTGDNFPNIT